jgi:hypothetical protein
MTGVRILLGAIAGLISVASQGQARDVAQDLANAEKTWALHRPPAYEFTIRIRCGLCTLVMVPPPTFRVKGGTATPVGDMGASLRKSYESFDTIDDLFTFFHQKLARKPAKFVVQYDPDLGYPTSADIDIRPDVDDDEIALQLTGFKALPSSTQPPNLSLQPTARVSSCESSPERARRG